MPSTTNSISQQVECWPASSSTEVVVALPTWQQKHKVKSSKHHGLACIWEAKIHFFSMWMWIAPDWSCWLASLSAEFVVVPPTWQQKHNEAKSSKYHGLACIWKAKIHFLSMWMWIAPDWSCWVASSSAEIVVVPPTWQQKHNEVKSSKHHGLVCKSNLYSLCLHRLSIHPRSYRILDHQLCWSIHVRCGSRRCLSGSGSRLNTTIDAIVEVIRKVRIHFKNFGGVHAQYN